MPLQLFQVAHSAADRLAIVDRSGEFTYRDVLSAAMAIRDGLLCGGDDLQGARIAFLVPAGFGYVTTLLGIWAAGGIAVPLCVKHPLPELQYFIQDTAASQLIVSPDFERIAESLSETSDIRIQLNCDLVRDRASRTVDYDDLPRMDNAHRAMILYTSGSTGRPKGVVSTHGNLVAQVHALIEAWGWNAEDRILHVLPLHHVHGIVNALLCALEAGAVCEFAHPFRPEIVWERFSSRELSLFMAVPTIYTQLIAVFGKAAANTQHRWSEGARAMRLHVSGSAALPIPVLKQWESITGQRLLERYGMTEIGMALSNPYHGDRRPGFVGCPLPGVEARRTNDSGIPAADHEQGEIEVRGQNVFNEYWNRPEETLTSFREGWFRTGDIAVVDDGSYRILGRSCVDIIKTGGYKVSALEIEDVLRDHPSIQDCAVVGIPDAEWGERVAVCAVCLESLDLEALRHWGKNRLASYKVPSLLSVRSELPRNAMGKVQKHLIQRLFESPDKKDDQDSKVER